MLSIKPPQKRWRYASSFKYHADNINLCFCQPTQYHQYQCPDGNWNGEVNIEEYTTVYPAWTSGGNYPTYGTRITHAGNSYSVDVPGISGTTPPTHTSGTVYSGPVAFTWLDPATASLYPIDYNGCESFCNAEIIYGDYPFYHSNGSQIPNSSRYLQNLHQRYMIWILSRRSNMLY